MDRLRPGIGHSSPYGQACMQCYKAKCRCVQHPSGNGCERSYFQQSQVLSDRDP